MLQALTLRCFSVETTQLDVSDRGGAKKELAQKLEELYGNGTLSAWRPSG